MALRRHIGLWSRIALLSLAGALATGPAAAEAEPPGALCERAVEHGARTVGVPREVLHAIALTETGRWQNGRFRPWPWAINREGKGFWFASREEALAFAKTSVEARRRSFDLGCFQINFHWHGHRFTSLEDMVDPKIGAVYAARFLRELYGEFGSWTAAAGAYHSRTPEHARRYRANFERILSRLGGAGALVLAEAQVEPQAPKSVPPVRRITAPRIITIVPLDTDEPDADEAARAPGIVRIVLDDLETPLPAGRRL
jgi:hypothetical protein